MIIFAIMIWWVFSIDKIRQNYHCTDKTDKYMAHNGIFHEFHYDDFLRVCAAKKTLFVSKSIIIWFDEFLFVLDS